MTPEQFIEKWRTAEGTERSLSQSHFLDLCELLEVPKPQGRDYCFEKAVKKPGGGQGFADVWMKGSFAWEYKGKGDARTLVSAYNQLKTYADGLGNPPLLVVSDMRLIRVKTNWTNTISEEHEIALADLTDFRKRDLLAKLFLNPEALRPDLTKEKVTAAAAKLLGELAAKLRRQKYDPKRVAHFLNRLVFCMFAEDVDLLPNRLFAELMDQAVEEPQHFVNLLQPLFRVMREHGGFIGRTNVPWFNGGLFDDDDVLPLGALEIRDVNGVVRLDWSAIEPSIYGTLFERGLDPEKRELMAGLFDAKAAKPRKGIAADDKGVGIHYTDPATIMKIVEPVVLAPLRAEWAEVKADLVKLGADAAKAKGAAKTKAVQARDKRYYEFRQHLRRLRVLDPACGSGNFLYMALQHLKDFERDTQNEAVTLGLAAEAEAITPQTVLGIEINPYAAELARMTIWIGELQWQMANAGAPTRRPILGSLHNIENRDALLVDGDQPLEAQWPEAECIIGNPPFLGDKAMIRNMGQAYVARLRQTFDGKVPGSVDLVCYWFSKAWDAISLGHANRAGFVSTNSVRSGANRKILEKITEGGVIFNAWTDEEWILDGAAVRVSLTCFSKNMHTTIQLSGKIVERINSDLTRATADVTKASKLAENYGVSFQGAVLVGPFDISGELARRWLLLPQNPNGSVNSTVLRPLSNGKDITSRTRGQWVIDFFKKSLEESAFFEAPFTHAFENIKPVRENNRRARRAEKWWWHGETGDGWRECVQPLTRFIATSQVSKHRFFVWLHPKVQPHQTVISFARDDDTTFGILHSKFHERWALRLGSWLGVGNDPRYTPSTTFETFPFPEGLTPNIPAKDYESDPRAQRIAAAAQRLNELRENWLNPPDLVRREPEVVPGFPDRVLPRGQAAEAILKKRTLTNLYNEKPQWLLNAHRDLDEAVAAAYGWPADLSDDDILARLLALNHERAAKQKK